MNQLRGLERNPHVVIARFRGLATHRVAARCRLLWIATLAMLPASMRFTGRRWEAGTKSGMELVEIDRGPGLPNYYADRPLNDERGGRISQNDVIFSAATFAGVFDLDWFVVETWLWTGRGVSMDQVPGAGPTGAGR